jgi:hypothetical protein
MHTIGKHNTLQLGDFAMECHYCQTLWPRSKLRRDAAGFLSCPDEGPGRDSVTLARLNAQGAASMPPIKARDKAR